MSTLALPVVTLVRAVNVGAAIGQGRIFVEHVPGNLADVVGKTFNQVASAGAPEDDAAAHQSLYNAVSHAQRVGTRLLDKLVAQNLFFIFSESAQALIYLPFESAPGNRFFYAGPSPADGANKQQAEAQQKRYADGLAVVLCHASNTEPLRHLIGGKDDKAKHQPQCYEVAWGELEKLQQWLEHIGHGLTAQQGGAA
jgi:hypothetical protein